MSDIIVQDRSEMPIQIPHELDEAELTPNQFRVYAHLARRAHKPGRAWPGIDSMAKVCRISKQGIIDAVKFLEANNMLTVHRGGGGKTNIYILTRRSSWVVTDLPTGRSSILTGQKSGTRGVKNRERKVLQSKKDNSTSKELDQLVVNIYEAYPRQVARPLALAAIAKALNRRKNNEIEPMTPERLLELTQQFAEAVNGSEARFIPHPATWFNQERYNDDPETWKRATDKKSGGRSTINASNSNRDRAGDY